MTRRFAALLFLLLAGCGQNAADDPRADSGPETGGSGQEQQLPGHIARIDEHSPAELEALLLRAEALLDENGTAAYPDYQPIEFILHGPEASIFVRQNYPRYQGLVDRAARLDAFGIVDIKICEAWMAGNGVDRAQLPAFVETVPYGPAAEEQLFRDGYIYF